MGSENRTMAESKKKWSDVKFESKKRVVAHGNSMASIHLIPEVAMGAAIRVFSFPVCILSA